MAPIRFKNLEKVEVSREGSVHQLSVPLPRTQNGKVDRACPAPDCIPARFQIGPAREDHHIPDERLVRVRRPPESPGTTCPYCGHDADGSAFTTEEDKRAALEQVKWAVSEDLRISISAMFENAFRSSKNVKFTRTSHPRPSPPRAHREDLLREVVCDTCARPYGVFAFALFCPGCGAANVSVHVRHERELVQAQLDSLEGEREKREHRFRSLTNALEDTVSCLESMLKGVYIHAIRRHFAQTVATTKTSKKSVGNSFQNVDRGRKLFAELGLDPFGALNQASLAELQLALAKRHVVTHNGGIADQEFITRTGVGREGQPVPLSAQEIFRILAICEAVAAHLEANCKELQPPEANSFPTP